MATPEVPSYGDLVTVVKVFLTIVVTAIIAISSFLFNIFYKKKMFFEGRSIKEREDIRHRLNKFYGPLKALRTESAILYGNFAIEEKKESASKGKYFRTLVHLAEGEDFSRADKEILFEINRVSSKTLDLIEEEGWAVENSNLSELLGRLAAHIRLMLLASEHKIDGHGDVVKSQVYPLEVDGAIESEIWRLKNRYNELLSDKLKPPVGKFLSHESGSVSYYDENGQDYYDATAYIDFSDIYKEFKNYLPLGSSILDAGCGVGRDTRYFIKNGFRVISFDASQTMVDFCNQYPFAYCLQMNFEEVEFIEEFDAVWACASLLHVPRNNIENVLSRLVSAVKSGGYIYMSLKAGSNDSFQEGRSFYSYKKEDILNLCVDRLRLEEKNIWQTETKLKNSSDIWVNYIFRKAKR